MEPVKLNVFLIILILNL